MLNTKGELLIYFRSAEKKPKITPPPPSPEPVIQREGVKVLKRSKSENDISRLGKKMGQ